MRLFVIVLGCAAFFTPALGQVAAPSGEIRDRATCREAIAVDARFARERAAQWWALGGGAEAKLCAAEALLALGGIVSAAQLLTEAGVEGRNLPLGDRVGALTLAGELWLSRHQPDLARKSYEAALTVYEHARQARIGLARVSAYQGAYGQAAAELSVLIAGSEKPDSEALTLRAAAFRAVGKPELARQDAQKALDVDPKNAIAWFELGAAFIELGDANEAREAFIEAITLDPEGPVRPMAEARLQALAFTSQP
jgi:tetratricopeptide (TPR) repeat protein